LTCHLTINDAKGREMEKRAMDILVERMMDASRWCALNLNMNDPEMSLRSPDLRPALDKYGDPQISDESVNEVSRKRKQLLMDHASRRSARGVGPRPCIVCICGVGEVTPRRWGVAARPLSLPTRLVLVEERAHEVSAALADVEERAHEVSAALADVEERAHEVSAALADVEERAHAVSAALAQFIPLLPSLDDPKVGFRC
jgi:hypothetical protein